MQSRLAHVLRRVKLYESMQRKDGAFDLAIVPALRQNIRRQPSQSQLGLRKAVPHQLDSGMSLNPPHIGRMCNESDSRLGAFLACLPWTSSVIPLHRDRICKVPPLLSLPADSRHNQSGGHYSPGLDEGQAQIVASVCVVAWPQICRYTHRKQSPSQPSQLPQRTSSDQKLAARAARAGNRTRHDTWAPHAASAAIAPGGTDSPNRQHAS